MEPTVSDLGFGILLPAVLAGLLLLVLRRALPGAVAGAIAVGLGYVAGHVGLRGWRGWVPRESTDWVAVVALLGLCVGVTGLTRRGPTGLRSLSRLLLAGLAAWLVVGKVLGREHEGLGLLRELLVLGAGIAVAWSALETLALPHARGGPVAVLFVTSLGCAAVLGISGSIVLAQLAGVLTSTLGATLVLCARQRSADVLLGVASPAALVLGVLLLAGLLLADVPPASALLLAAVPLGALVVRLGAEVLHRRAASSGEGRRASADGAGTLCAQLIVCAGLAGAAFWLALQASPPLDAAGY